jgi:hypothetical protein
MKLADVLKTLDIDMELDDEAIITDVVVVAKVQRMDGSTTVAHARTEGTDWITVLGLTRIGYWRALKVLGEDNE